MPTIPTSSCCPRENKTTPTSTVLTMAAFRSARHLPLLLTVAFTFLVVALLPIGDSQVAAMEADSQIEIEGKVLSKDAFEYDDQSELTESPLLRKRRPKGRKKPKPSQPGYCEDGQTQCEEGTRCACLESTCQGNNNNSNETPDIGTQDEEAGKPNTVTVTNNCDYILRVRKFGCARANTEMDPCNTVKDGNDRFILKPKTRKVVSLPARWSGRFWGFKCPDAQGMNCDCAVGSPCDSETSLQHTLAEMTFDGFEGNTFYDLGLVDAYNIPLSLRPTPGTFKNDGGVRSCKLAACNAQAQAFILSNCPKNMQLKTNRGVVIGCQSECKYAEKTRSPEKDRLCCTGMFDRNRCTDPSCTTCRPNMSPCPKCVGGQFAMQIKKICPLAYTFPNDDVDPTSGQLSCKPTIPGKANYDVTFCP